MVLDVHKKKWSVSIYLKDQHVKTFHQESSAELLLQHLNTLYWGNIQSVLGSWICDLSVQRSLKALNIDCSVVNAADVPQTNKGKLSKTDGSDSRKIGEAFAKGLLIPIYIPTSQTEADRNLILRVALLALQCNT